MLFKKTEKPIPQFTKHNFMADFKYVLPFPLQRHATNTFVSRRFTTVTAVTAVKTITKCHDV